MRNGGAWGARWGGWLAMAAMLASCGGGDGSSGGGSGTAGGAAGGTTGSTGGSTGTGTGSSTNAGCTLAARQQWLLAQMNEWYLFPETLPTGLDPAAYTDLSTYLDALTATARAQGRDRYFSYVTSVAEENAYYNSGSTAGFGIRLALDTSNQLFVIESFENGPALNAGIDRGTQIVGIGTSSSTVRTVSDIIASQGTDGLTDALGPDDSGVQRVMRIRDAAGTRDVTLAKADFTLSPLSSRYGYRIIADGGRQVGYVNLRTFISTANDQLRTAFAAFRAQGINQVIVDLRYNGGGLVSVAELLTNLLGADRSTADVQAYTTFRTSKSSQNKTTYFAPPTQAIAPMKIAFIGTGRTASASEYVINAMIPYLHGNAALIGSNTYGKPVGQIALDNPACPDDRLRVIAFALQNAARQGDYFNGLASKVEASCQASDDISYQLGDANEASTRAALDFLAGRSCTRIGATASVDRAAAIDAPERRLLTPADASTPQRELPGLF